MVLLLALLLDLFDFGLDEMVGFAMVFSFSLVWLVIVVSLVDCGF